MYAWYYVSTDVTKKQNPSARRCCARTASLYVDARVSPRIVMVLMTCSRVHEIGRVPIAYRGKDERVERVLMYYCTSSLLALVQDAAEEPSTYCFSVYPGNKT